jgi:hypothetical protein
LIFVTDFCYRICEKDHSERTKMHQIKPFKILIIK